MNRVPEKPEVHMDFMFMGEEKFEKTLVMLVAKERSTKAVMGCVVPMKSEGEWLAKRVMAFMREFGCELEAVTMKIDNEPALVAVVDHIGSLGPREEEWACCGTQPHTQQQEQWDH